MKSSSDENIIFKAILGGFIISGILAYAGLNSAMAGLVAIISVFIYCYMHDIKNKENLQKKDIENLKSQTFLLEQKQRLFKLITEMKINIEDEEFEELVDELNFNSNLKKFTDDIEKEKDKGDYDEANNLINGYIINLSSEI